MQLFINELRGMQMELKVSSPSEINAINELLEAKDGLMPRGKEVWFIGHTLKSLRSVAPRISDRDPEMHYVHNGEMVWRHPASDSNGFLHTLATGQPSIWEFVGMIKRS